MAKIYFTWSCENSGNEEIDLEDYDITLEEWNDMCRTAQIEILQEYLDNGGDAVAYGWVDSFEVVKE